MSSDNSVQIVDIEETPHARTARQRERETAILRAAIAEFASAGFENARLDDIAQRAGVAKGTLYLYYTDKAALFKAAVRSVIHPMLARIQEQALVAESSAADLLRSVFNEFYREMVSDDLRRELVRLLIAEGRRFPDLGDFYHDEVIARGMATFRMILWRGVATGEFCHSAAEEFPQLLMAPCIAFSNWQLMFGDRHSIDRDRYAAAHLQFVLAALSTPKSD
jgi:AcrR family transcriptional regulator